MNDPESYEKRIKTKGGHRQFIGASNSELWHNIGKMQYHYLVAQGLQPGHKFLDVACGSLRLGQWLIPMLDKGNYYGIDGTRKLIEEGIKKEMLYNIAQVKCPNFAYNYEFNLDFIDEFDFSIAQSLFTHLTINDIDLCFKNISKKMHAKSKFYCTFFEGEESKNPNSDSDPHKNWFYKFETLQKIAEINNQKLTYIGDWNHPRHQKLFLSELK